jgi:thioesterase domain-containing protein
MARQLTAGGEQVGLLLLLDCLPPTALKSAIRRAKWGWARIKKIAQPKAEPAPEAAKAAVGADDSEQNIKDEQWVCYQKMLMRYRPKPYSGKLHLILNQQYAEKKIDESWRPFARDGVTTTIVTGDHTSYIRDHAQPTAAIIAGLLRASGVDRK